MEGNFVSTGKGCCCISLCLAGGPRSIKVGGQQPNVCVLRKSGRRDVAACCSNFVNVRACVRACKRGLSHMKVRETSWVRELLQNGTQNTLHLLTASVMCEQSRYLWPSCYPASCGHSGSVCLHSSFGIFVTAWSRVLLGKLTVPQTFYGTRSFIYPTRFQATAARWMRTAVFWVITRRVVLRSYRRFGTT